MKISKNKIITNGMIELLKRDLLVVKKQKENCKEQKGIESLELLEKNMEESIKEMEEAKWKNMKCVTAQCPYCGEEGDDGITEMLDKKIKDASILMICENGHIFGRTT